MRDEDMVNKFQIKKRAQLFDQNEEDKEENHHQAMLKLKGETHTLFLAVCSLHSHLV